MNTYNIQSIKAQIKAAEAVVAKSQPLADKLAEMQAAVKAVTAASESLGVLRAQLAQAEKAQEIRAAALDRLTVQSITASERSVASRHTVNFTERFHGLDGPEVRPVRYALDGLSADMLDVVVANLDKVPGYILALDADPEQAIRKHAAAVRRGYISA